MTTTRKRIQNADAIRAALLAWYDTAHRDLPWRRTSDPYRIWVSEIMLQQTRVEAMTPYYERWLARYPTLLALAQADEQDVLKQWEGLGYYSRARNLHGAARLIRERHNGNVPATSELLRSLPGIGDYTAGAIASIAYGERVPAVDGNVRRVLSRLFDRPAPDAKAVQTLARTLVDPARPGDFNQALMELGSTVCTPRSPRCNACPLALHCRALRKGTVALRPGTHKAKPLPHEHVNTLVILRDGDVVLARRPDKGLLAGLWQFPEAALLPKNARPIGEVTQTFTHKRITYHVFQCSTRRRLAANERWVSLSELPRYAMPKAQRKIEALITDRS